jgi:thioredoxin-like negative regulator of GroEL
VDAEAQPGLVRKFGIEKVPTLVLVRDKKIIDRIDGRASMPQIEALLETNLPALQSV